MVKITALYGQPGDPEEFEAYYAETHMPLVERLPNLRRYEASLALASADGGAPPYYRTFEGYFDTIEDLQSGMTSPEGQDVVNDLPNFATGGVTVFISEVIS